MAPAGRAGAGMTCPTASTVMAAPNRRSRSHPWEHLAATGRVASDGELPGLGARVTVFDLAPVDDVPPRLEIVGTPVLILQIVGVFPNVIPHEDALPVHQGRVLIGLRDQRELAALVHGDEHPARSEDAGAARIELVLQLLETAEVTLDCLKQLALRRSAGTAPDPAGAPGGCVGVTLGADR